RRFLRAGGFFRAVSSPVPARPHFSDCGRVFPRGFFPCNRADSLFRPRTGIFARFLSLYPRGFTFPTSDGYFRAVSSPVPARIHFSDCGRVFPRGFFPCTRAAGDFCARAGFSARFLPLYPRGLRFLRADGYFRAIFSLLEQF
ncbi:MAG: hypothetical protein PUB17_04815, partial [Lachnospiraceae bacterium]|nr:hypothetical protein [Lachnospiraceae bacterium]